MKTVSSSTSINIQNMINYLNTAKELNNATSWQWALNNLLGSYSELISSEYIKSPRDYLLAAPGYVNAEEKAQTCKDRSFSMCVETITGLKKCQVLSDISIAYGIQPRLNCVMDSDCGETLKASNVDMMILDADKMAIFRRYMLARTFNGNQLITLITNYLTSENSVFQNQYFMRLLFITVCIGK